MSTNHEPANEHAGAQMEIPVRRPFNRRRKTCPFAGKNPPVIDYKNPAFLETFISEKGKIIPSRISAVDVKKQRELSVAIKQARFMALMPYIRD